MKRILVSSFLLALFIFNINKSISQDTLILQPSGVDGKDASIGDWNPSANYAGDSLFKAFAWTFSGTEAKVRSLIDFDLSSIPANSIITKAVLSLYHYPYPGVGGVGHSTLSGSNACFLQRIISDWDENTVTWDSQPSATTHNQAEIPQSTSPTQDYLDIDVTSLVRDMFDNPSTSFGFMMRLVTEEFWRSMNFASSDFSISSYRPKLEIVYYEGTDTCITLQPDATIGKDASIGDWNPSANYAGDSLFKAFAWTFSGTEAKVRSLIDFDLSSIPANSIITKAVLSLYHYPYPGVGGVGHSTLSGSNACFLQRIISDWEENTVSWNSQPLTTTLNEVYIPQSISPTQDYPDINVTSLVQDMIDNPSTSYGFMMRLVTEEYWRSMNFASSDFSISNYRPKLEICYLISVSINTISSVNNIFKIYPNPTNDIIYIELNKIEDATVEILNIYGQTIFRKDIKKRIDQVNISGYPNGMYIVRLKSAQNQQSKRLIKY